MIQAYTLKPLPIKIQTATFLGGQAVYMYMHV